MSTNDDHHHEGGRRGLRRREALAAAGTLGLSGLLATTRLGAAAGTPRPASRSAGPTSRSGTAMPAACTRVTRACRRAAGERRASRRRDRPRAAGRPRAGGGAPGGHQEPTDSKRYLRGHQKSDERGRVRFLTVFPGWYSGRTPHVHLKVHAGGQVVHTGQVFFNQRITAEVYKRAPYKSHGRPDTSHAADAIFAAAGKSKAVLKLRRRRHAKRGYRGTITLGVATA
jgi:hypothetical protein